ncbi:HBR441Cp [Eremothecium sinecaudum]|uniref:Large ribosomal subunit protein bL21m n=1 Tax=Eremothecium sinecaudum TaxID=45286 RepID=A0A109UY94_9SACH|nr:HBR441Cp [Eremothecium sinecaudum]AMD19342.1 HBR441Cp [Eremothecium sinecaudum]
MFRALSQGVWRTRTALNPLSYFSDISRSFCNTNLHSQAKQLDVTPLKLSNELYATFRIHNRPYLVTKGDKVYLPFNLKQGEIGDVLHLKDVTTIGSRNFKIVDEPLDPSLFTLTATIVEKTKLPYKVKEVTKRRNRRVRHAISKPCLTVLRISELKIN